MEDSPSDERPEYLTASPNYHIIMVLLGHPHHLASLTELAYYIQSDADTLTDILEQLADRDVLAQYLAAPQSQADPAIFWGFTPAGIDLLEDVGYLRLLPILRPLHDATESPYHIQRHEAAARPALPPTVKTRLSYPEPTPAASDDDDDQGIPLDESLYADNAPEDPSTLAEDSEGSKTLDDLFS